MDCLKHFTVLEHLDNYRCDHCWHNAAAKYFSLQSEVDEVKFCDHIFYEVVLVSQFSLTVPHIDICTRKKLTNCAPVSTMIVAIASIYLVQRKQHGQYLQKPQSSWLSLVVRRYLLLKYTFWNLHRIISKNGMTPIDVLFQILCIHLLRASISFDGELVKRQVSTKKDT